MKPNAEKLLKKQEEVKQKELQATADAFAKEYQELTVKHKMVHVPILMNDQQAIWADIRLKPLEEPKESKIIKP